MPNFENYSAGESRDETERLYGNDNSPKKFSGKPYVSADELPGSIGLYGELDDLSEEDRIYDKLDNGAKNDDALLSLGKICDDYLNDRAGLPASVTEAEARELALIYRESLTEEENKVIEDEINSSKTLVRHTEIVNLKRGQAAKATPNSDGKVKLDRRSQQEYAAKKIRRAV